MQKYKFGKLLDKRENNGLNTNQVFPISKVDNLKDLARLDRRVEAVEQKDPYFI